MQWAGWRSRQESCWDGLWKNLRPNRSPQHSFQKQNPNKTSLDSWSDLIYSPANFMKAGELVTQSIAACRAVLWPKWLWWGGAGSESCSELLCSTKLCFRRSLVHLSFISSVHSHHLQLCHMPCVSCNFPVPREGGRWLHYYIQPQLHHFSWVQRRAQPQFVRNTMVFFSLLHFRPRRVCAFHSPVPEPLVSSQLPSQQTAELF